MKRRYVAYSAILSFILLLVTPLPSQGASFTSETLRNMLAGGADEASLCSSVKYALAKGVDAKDVVRVAVEMGHSACLAIKCALMSGGNLGEVVDGATGAGVTCDVVSRCCMDAGVAAEAVAANLTSCYGLGYSDPPQTLTMPDMPATPPVISPHTF